MRCDLRRSENGGKEHWHATCNAILLTRSDLSSSFAFNEKVLKSRLSFKVQVTIRAKKLSLIATALDGFDREEKKKMGR